MKPNHQIKNRNSLFLICIILLSLWWTGCSFAEDWTVLNDYYQGAERYNSFEENPFIYTAIEPVSTFSTDADGAAYANMRRMVNADKKPLKDAIRTEEFVNYFQYDYPEPEGTENIGINGEVSSCPWNVENRLIRIGIKGKTIPLQELPPSNFVLLIDVSGSMAPENKLPLLKSGLIYLVNTLREEDKIAIVTYSGKWETVLSSTSGNQKTVINNAIQSLETGGGTAGSAGINAAYQIAEENFVSGGNNRIIIATDGDFNIGITDKDQLIDLIKLKRQSGIYLTVIGLGSGNLNEALMESVANNGNGIYEYMDNLEQARKIFEYEFNKFYSIADDVKIQVEFDQNLVSAYRLIGYENRLLQNNEFESDTTDAGDISVGQTITALYEIIPAICAECSGIPSFTIDFRYKMPGESVSREITMPITDYQTGFAESTENNRFAASVVAYAMLLRQSPYKGNVTFSNVIDWAQNARNYDPHLFREEFIELVETVNAMD
ncbi:MAG: von Willebrand factor type A domain-containing protein [Sphingobacteriales bacterium]|nr:MAG: von Willebrand factor type A domain-containing protein [Sphingobacteriales bacterium]